MKRTLSALAFVLLSSAMCAAQSSFGRVTLTMRAEARTEAYREAPPRAYTSVTVPADTEAAIEMLSGLHSRASHVNDYIEARLTRPVYVDGRLAIPDGTLLEGRVARVQPAGRMRHGAQMTLRFDMISLPDGQTAPISAIISAFGQSGIKDMRVDEEGNLKGTRGFSMKRILGGVAGVGGFTTIRAAMAGAATIAYSLPASGAAFVGAEFLIPHGNEVHIPPETQFRIRLNNPVTLQIRT
ncbi:MAG: hypothetical protein ACM3NO_08425 [Deltaproteobacteria bacterium]